MACATVESLSFRSDVSAAGEVVRVAVTDIVAPSDAPRIGDAIRLAQAGAAVTLLDLRAAEPLTPTLLDLVTAADARAWRTRRRLIVLHASAPGEPDEGWERLGLAAQLVSTAGAPHTASWRHPFAVLATPRDAGVTFEVFGELDVATCPQLDSALEEHAARTLTVTLDLRGVVFMDSTGLHLLIRAFEGARLRGASISLLTSVAVRRTLNSAGLRDHFAHDAGEPARR